MPRPFLRQFAYPNVHSRHIPVRQMRRYNSLLTAPEAPDTTPPLIAFAAPDCSVGLFLPLGPNQSNCELPSVAFRSEKVLPPSLARTPPPWRRSSNRGDLA